MTLKVMNYVCLISLLFYFRTWNEEIVFDGGNETDKGNNIFKILAILH